MAGWSTIRGEESRRSAAVGGWSRTRSLDRARCSDLDFRASPFGRPANPAADPILPGAVVSGNPRRRAVESATAMELVITSDFCRFRPRRNSLYMCVEKLF